MSGCLSVLTSVNAAAASGSATFTATGNPAGQDTGTNTATFNGVSIGAAASGDVIVAVFSSETTVASAIQINGSVNMVKVVEESSTISGLQIWRGTTVSGGTANFVVTAGGNMNQQTLQVGFITGQGSVVPSNSGSATTFSAGITVPASGAAVVGMFGVKSGTPAWTAATQDYETIAVSGEALYMAHASASATVSATNMSSVHMVYASWGP